MEELEKRLYALARHDLWHKQCLSEVENREADFERIRSALSETDQEALDLYISACEELEHSLTLIALRMLPPPSA